MSGNAAAAAQPSIVIKAFKISKEATAEQRRAERVEEQSAADRRQEKFERKWCSHHPFKPIWRPPVPEPVPQAAKRKWSDEMDGEPFAAGRPQHLELDKWLRHTIASRRREQEQREAAILERKRSREAHREREARRQGQEGMVGTDGSQSVEEDLEDEVDERPKTLQERLLQAQIDRDGSSRIEADGLARNTEGWGGDDGVRCRLHSADRLHGLKPCLVMNLFPGGFSIDGEQQGRVYGTDSKEFLEGLDRGKIPARKLLELAGHSNFSYSDGCLLVEVRDFRVPRNADQKPAVWTVVLTADSGAVAKDLAVVAESYQNLNSDDLLLVEKRMLVTTQPTVCLTPDPHVAVVASSLQRRANRMGVWHPRQARATASVSRRTFDAGAMRRLHAAVHVSTTPGLDLANPPLSSRPARPDTEEVDEEGSTEGSLSSLRPGHDTVPVCRGVWKNNRLLEGWDMDGDGQDGAIQMATALRQLKASQFRWEVDQDKLPGPKSSHGVASAKRGANDGERAIARNFFLPRQYLRDGTPPERQMRFRKGNQIVTIAIESKGASSFQLRSWLHEFGDDGKPLENGQVNMPPQMIGNSVQARIFGGQLFAVYHREGWQCTGDSHQPATRKGVAGGQGTGGAARPTGQQQQQQQQQRSAGPGGMNNAGRGMSQGGGRGVAPAGYAGNGGPAGAARQAVPKTKAAPQTHQQMTSPHMMAGRGAPQMHPQQQARAPMPHPGGVPGQQMHMQHGYRPTAGAHQMPPQHQQYAHQVPAHAAHPSHPSHQAQGVPPYHSAAGRGYPPQQYQVAGRAVPGQPGVRPGAVAPQGGSAPPQTGGYRPHPAGTSQAYAVPQQPQQPYAVPLQQQHRPGLVPAATGTAMPQQTQQPAMQQQPPPGSVAKPAGVPPQGARPPGQGPHTQQPQPTYQQPPQQKPP